MNSKYIKESARQIRFEIDIIKNLELNNFTDKTLEKYIQDHLNHFYGLETVGFFKKRKTPIKYCIINKEANIFITTRKKYVHFRNKYKNYLDYCENLIDDSFYFDTQPSAPPLEKF